MNYAVVDKRNGQVVKFITSDSYETAQLNCDAGCELIPCNAEHMSASGDCFYENGQFHFCSPATDYEEFDYDTRTYVDTRTEDDLIRAAKARRDELLVDSDWTQLPDVPIKLKEKYQEYRQQLRDVPAQPGYPYKIHWPTEPN